MADVRTIYERAIFILAAEDEGLKADSSRNADYRARTPAILNTLLGLVYPRLEGLERRKEGIRPVPRWIEGFEDEVDLEEGAALALLPLGLAGHLALEENPSVSGYLLSKFEAEANRFARLAPAGFEQITDCYGGLGYGG